MTDPAPARRRVAITGASGLIGTAVREELAARGVGVVRLVRGPATGPDEATWTVEHGIERPAALAGVDAVVHLAGESIADGRWTPERKRRLRDSRIPPTQHLVRSLAALPRPPAVFIAASAIGVYGDRGDETLTEASAAGTGFLAGLAREWEDAANERAGAMRVVNLRFGLVLSARGGLLHRLRLPFRLGLGGTVGRPGAWWSWVAIDDVAGLVAHAIETAALAGPLNVTAPGAVTSAAFAAALGRALHRPAILPVPAFALRLAFGEMADELMLASARAVPARALASGYAFRWPELDAALVHVLGRG